MSARDDYPGLAHFGSTGEHGGLEWPHTTTEARRALDEMDRLRKALERMTDGFKLIDLALDGMEADLAEMQGASPK